MTHGCVAILNIRPKCDIISVFVINEQFSALARKLLYVCRGNEPRFYNKQTKNRKREKNEPKHEESTDGRDCGGSCGGGCGNGLGPSPSWWPFLWPGVCRRVHGRACSAAASACGGRASASRCSAASACGGCASAASAGCGCASASARGCGTALVLITRGDLIMGRIRLNRMRPCDLPTGAKF